LHQALAEKIGDSDLLSGKSDSRSREKDMCDCLTLGICGDATASPFPALPPADIHRVWSIVEALGPVLPEIPSAGVSIRDLE